MDFVPIVPYTTDILGIGGYSKPLSSFVCLLMLGRKGIGQRYDVIVTANQSDIASDFWLRAIPDVSIVCSLSWHCSDDKQVFL